MGERLRALGLDFRHGLLQGFDMATCRDDVRAEGSETERDGLAHAAASAGHEDGAALEEAWSEDVEFSGHGCCATRRESTSSG